MMSQEKLAVALILALASNAVLLFVILVKFSGVAYQDGVPSCCSKQSYKGVDTDKELQQIRSYQVEKSLLDLTAKSAPGKVISVNVLDDVRGVKLNDFSGNEMKLLSLLLKKKLSKLQNSGKASSDVNSDFIETGGSASYADTIRRTTSSFTRQDHHSLKMTKSESQEEQMVQSSSNDDNLQFKDGASFSNLTSFRDNSSDSDSSRSDRKRRHVFVDPSGSTVNPENTPQYDFKEVFSTFTDNEKEQFEIPVASVLLPALIQFEVMVIREIENLHNAIVTHDLRLEELEHVILTLNEGNDPRVQSDAKDNKSDLDNLKHVLGEEEGLMYAGNMSEVIPLEFEGSGDVDWSVTASTTLPPTTTDNLAYYDLVRAVGGVEQKVMALENYNVMSDGELTRIRSEVVKMDDKLTELDRRQRNMQIRTSMQIYKITELEQSVSKNELGIHSALDSYSRVSSRLEGFKDRLTDFKNDLHAVSVQFGRHDQIANELRAADAYKAHDISEMRKSIYGVEGRVNGLYRVIDQHIDTLQSDLRNMLDRLCFNNKLAC